MDKTLKVHCDTNTLSENTSSIEVEALKRLSADERVMLFSSRRVRHEAMNTKDQGKRNRLVAEHEACQPVSKDEKIVGFIAQS
jgi:hypothetical protein